MNDQPKPQDTHSILKRKKNLIVCGRLVSFEKNFNLLNNDPI
jgi:hypothetical protein